MKCIKKKIYYYDTDAGGVVYYANYLKYFEQARSEFLEENGILPGKLLNQGIGFVVARAEIDFKKPVRYMDTIEILTDIEKTGSSSIIFVQKALKDGALCCHARITVVCVNNNLKPVRIPEFIKNALGRQHG